MIVEMLLDALKTSMLAKMKATEIINSLVKRDDARWAQSILKEKHIILVQETVEKESQCNVRVRRKR